MGTAVDLRGVASYRVSRQEERETGRQQGGRCSWKKSDGEEEDLLGKIVSRERKVPYRGGGEVLRTEGKIAVSIKPRSQACQGPNAQPCEERKKRSIASIRKIILTDPQLKGTWLERRHQWKKGELRFTRRRYASGKKGVNH